MLELDKNVYEIAKKLITTSDTKLTIDPISMKYFIKSDSRKLFLVIEEKNIKIAYSNDNYYDLYVDFKVSKKIIQLFEKIQQRRSKKMEKEIFSNMTLSIHNISRELNN